MDNTIENHGTATFESDGHGQMDEAIESLVDRFVTDGMSRDAVLDGMHRSIDRLRQGSLEDPDPAEEPMPRTQGDGVHLEEPANDWPSS